MIVYMNLALFCFRHGDIPGLLFLINVIEILVFTWICPE